ncbi:MAG: hypothetical protein H7A23_16115 [Leptospiraceae bacterium]|nr:hypothetical protein [Leptospiraceae bacterium]MCP5496072.1 hypothetical protein [Leptospiraceae bacterium]
MSKTLSILVIFLLLQIGFNCKKSSDPAGEESVPSENVAVKTNSIVGEWKGNTEIVKGGAKIMTASVQATFTENSYKIDNNGKTTVNEEECDVVVTSEGGYTKNEGTITVKPTKETQTVCGKDVPSKLEEETYKLSFEGDSLILSFEEDGVTSTTTLKK